MPAAIRVTPWHRPRPRPVLGHDPRSWYAETFWLPTLGPTALLLMRHLADRFEHTPAGPHAPSGRHCSGARCRNPGGHVVAPAAHAHPTPSSSSSRTPSERRRPSPCAARVPPVHRRHVRRLPAELRAHPTRNGSHRQLPKRRDRHFRRRARVALTLLVQGDGDGHRRTVAAQRSASIPRSATKPCAGGKSARRYDQENTRRRRRLNLRRRAPLSPVPPAPGPGHARTPLLTPVGTLFRGADPARHRHDRGMAARNTADRRRADRCQASRPSRGSPTSAVPTASGPRTPPPRRPRRCSTTWGIPRSESARGRTA